MDVCRKFGVATMTMLPFNIATLMYTGTENALYASAAQRKINTYFNLAKNLNRNSWGTAWGDNGFAYASPAYVNGGFFNESYGVTV
jgi:hypothetical protein